MTSPDLQPAPRLVLSVEAAAELLSVSRTRIGCNYGVNLTGTELSPCLSASVSGSLPHPLSPALVFSRRPSLSPRGSELFPT